MSVVLIKELIRRGNLNGIQQGIFVSETLVARPISSAAHYYRVLKLKRLMNTGFVTIPKGLNNQQYAKLMAVESVKEIDITGNRREMTTSDIP